MIREEINEIKKQFNKDTNVITKYAGCYVDAEKNIKFMTKDAFTHCLRKMPSNMRRFSERLYQVL